MVQRKPRSLLDVIEACRQGLDVRRESHRAMGVMRVLLG